MHTAKEYGGILIQSVNQWRWTAYGISKESEFICEREGETINYFQLPKGFCLFIFKVKLRMVILC